MEGDADLACCCHGGYGAVEDYPNLVVESR
jgi:hypothetical protein